MNPSNVTPLPVVTGSLDGVWGEIANAIATGQPMPPPPQRVIAPVLLKQGTARIGDFPDVDAALAEVRKKYPEARLSKSGALIVASYYAEGTDGKVSKHVIHYTVEKGRA
jgi:hypothetical protein